VAFCSVPTFSDAVVNLVTQIPRNRSAMPSESALTGVTPIIDDALTKSTRIITLHRTESVIRFQPDKLFTIVIILKKVDRWQKSLNKNSLVYFICNLTKRLHLIFYSLYFTVEKSRTNWATDAIFKNLSKVNKRPIGEYSTNVATLPT
jgi:hypothetical protein